MEMRAVWFVLQNWNDVDSEKLEWKENFKNQLDSLAHKEAQGQLSDDAARHIAYLVKVTYCI